MSEAKEVKDLIDKAAKAAKSEDALRFSQAACNVAHAINSSRDPSDLVGGKSN
jgi:hypothetical protein